MLFTKKCPVCDGRMVKFQDDVGRRWVRCTLCGAQFPLENKYMEVKNGLPSKI